MDWQKIVIHHTASPTEVRRSGKLVPVDAAMIREWHKTKGWSDIGYHFIISPDGRCEAGRPIYRPGAHCHVGHRNFIGIGLCLVGNFSETEVPDAQLVGLVNKVVQLMEAFKLGIETVELHKDVPGAATECPGRYFPKDVFMKKLEESFQPTKVTVATLNFTYPNNAKVVNDNLYIRDINGLKITDRWVAKGDKITVLDVSYSKQLVLLEYPTPSGVAKGYATNATKCLQYDHQGKWLNGSTSESVMDENGVKIGVLDPREQATPLYRKKGKLHVVYSTDKGIDTKSGYVTWDGGFLP